MAAWVGAVLYVASTSFVSASRDDTISSADGDFTTSKEQVGHSRSSCECFRDLGTECPKMEDFGHNCDDEGGWETGKCADAGLGVVPTRKCCPRTCCERSKNPHCEMTCAEINGEAELHARNCGCVADLAPRRCRIMAAFKRTCGDGQPFKCQNGQMADNPEACCPQTCCQEGVAPTCFVPGKEDIQKYTGSGMAPSKAFCQAIDKNIRQLFEPKSKSKFHKSEQYLKRQQKLREQRCKLASVNEASGQQRPVGIDKHGTVVILKWDKNKWKHSEEPSPALNYKVLDTDWNFANGCTWKCNVNQDCTCGFFPDSF